MGIMRAKKVFRCENTFILILDKLEKIKIPAKTFSHLKILPINNNNNNRCQTSNLGFRLELPPFTMT